MRFSLSLVFGLFFAFTTTLAVASDRNKSEKSDNPRAAGAGSTASASAKPTRNSKAWGEDVSMRVDRYAAANQLTADLTHKLGLSADACSQEQLATLMGHLLGTDTADGYVLATANIHTLDQLLRLHTGTMQRELSAWLPEQAYNRYVALLDGLAIK